MLLATCALQVAFVDVPLVECQVILAASGALCRCQHGFYAVGYSRDTCTHCGQGLTTVQMGASMLDDCIAIPGWQRKQRQGLLLEEPYTAEECPVGDSTHCRHLSACRSRAAG